MKVEVKVPEAGESITEGVIVEWYREDGDFVAVDEALYDLETDKVTMTVQSTAAGRITIRVAADQKVSIGQVVAVIDTDAASSAAQPAQATSRAAGEPTVATARDVAPPDVAANGPPLSTPAGLSQLREKLGPPDEALADLSPAVRRMVVERGLDPAAIPGTGKDNRVTKEDVVAFLERAPALPEPEAAPAPAREPAAAPEVPAAGPRPPADGEAPPKPTPLAPETRQTRRPMSPLRHRIAERLVEAQQTAAILTTFNEADLSHVLALREKWKKPFEERHGVRLGMMSFFVKAVVDALQAVPQLNARIEGDEVVYNHYYDIGVAVGTERGLIVPTVRDADRLSFAGVEKAIAALAKKARDRKITLADLSGGVFTISNGGIYGSMLSTPILNPPQSGILGLHAIKKRAVVVPDGAGGDTIAIRPMMYLAMSYDHRLVDGREAVTFLKRIVECIEHPDRMLLDV